MADEDLRRTHADFGSSDGDNKAIGHTASEDGHADQSHLFDQKKRDEYARMEGVNQDAFRRTGDNPNGSQVIGNPKATAAQISARFQQSETDTTISEQAAKRYGHHDFAAKNSEYRGPSIPYMLSNNPKAGQWDGRKLTRNMIAAYKRFVVTDGEGIRNSIYVSGCMFRCKECWNASIWDFGTGHPYTQAFEDAVIKDLEPDYVEGLTFLGGEPFLNTPVLLKIAHRARAKFGDSRNIWSWSGYTWEELMRPGTTPDKLELLGLIDILVDGRFIASQKSNLLQFRGSKNQRVIDVPASIAARKKALADGLVRPGDAFCGIAAEDSAKVKPVIWSGLHDQTLFIPEQNLKDRAAGEGTY
jgi:anaerobic ribonucleoside-triphosphate reductase activating protein